jgi:hypothetical protein
VFIVSFSVCSLNKEMSHSCPYCGSTEIDEDISRGDATCMGCGTVLEEGRIVTDVQFHDAGAGGYEVIGEFFNLEVLIWSLGFGVFSQSNILHQMLFIRSTLHRNGLCNLMSNTRCRISDCEKTPCQEVSFYTLSV